MANTIPVRAVPQAYQYTPRRRSAAPSGGKSGGGGLVKNLLGAGASVPATREIGGMAEGNGDQGPPQLERQGALRATAAGPAYTPGSLMGIITGGVTGDANEAFDASKPIGGANVPYKETTGLGGWFQRLAGNKANQLNAAAQAEQGAEWRSEAAENRAAQREDARFTRAEEAATRRFEQARRAQVEDRDLTMEQQRIRDAQRWMETDADREQAMIDKSIDRAAREQARKDEAAYRTKQLELAARELELKGRPTPEKMSVTDIGGIPYVTQGNQLYTAESGRLKPLRAVQPYNPGVAGALPPGGGVTRLDAEVPPQNAAPVNQALLPTAARGVGKIADAVMALPAETLDEAYRQLIDSNKAPNTQRRKSLNALPPDMEFGYPMM